MICSLLWQLLGNVAPNGPASVSGVRERRRIAPRVASFPRAMLLMLATLSMLPVAICAGSDLAPKGAPPRPAGSCELVSLSKADDGRTIELTADQIVYLSLEWQPGTGFDWQMTSLDDQVLRPLARGSTQHDPLLGAAGMVHWFFEAGASGRTTLVLESRRPWESDGEVAGSLTINFVVDDSNLVVDDSNLVVDDSNLVVDDSRGPEGAGNAAPAP